MHVQLKNIVKEYPNPAGAHRVLNNVNLGLVPGDFVAIVGSYDIAGGANQSGWCDRHK